MSSASTTPGGAAEHARNILADWDTIRRDKTWPSLSEPLKFAWAGALAASLRELLAAYDDLTGGES